ncbi:MAG: alpha/beta fold hydrolase [Mycobacterium sp.]|jgi:pimeloyl-ACP methyl ester carboxylesterase|uniref:alpha/beta fold hydrolase n=1 Tax=Mycobacterium sp. TaxID=1785 RepID=UPI003899EBB2
MTEQQRDFWIESDRVRLRGIDWGGNPRGKTAIMLHGVGGTAMAFNMLAPRLVAALGDRYRFVSIDQRGGGDSDKPSSGYEPEFFGRDVLAVQQTMGSGVATLIGHSRGGWLAPYVAGRWPHAVERIVLIDPARMTYESKEAMEVFYGNVRDGLGPFASPEAAIENAMRNTPDAYWGPERQASVFSCYYTAFDGSLFGKMPHWVLDELQRVRDEDVIRPLTDAIRVPTLVLVSSRSDAHRQSQKLEYAERIAGSRVVMLDGTHSLQHDCVEQVAAEIAAHLVNA